MGLLRQTWTLIGKTLLIVVGRHSFSTIIRAFFLPVTFMLFISYARNLFIPPAHYGIGTPTPIRSLSSALDGSTGGRDTVVFVNNGLSGGPIDQVIAKIADPVRASGKVVKYTQRPEDLLQICPSSLIGVSKCFAAVVFYSSPTEHGSLWNYTIRVDGALGRTIDVRNSNNDAEIYTLPLQHAVDSAIVSLNDTAGVSKLPSTVLEYPYTSRTQKERADNIRVRYMSGIIQVLAVAFFIGFVGVVYQSVGFMASERELGMSQLIEAMMPITRNWHPQMVRLIAHHLAFDVIYVPGWIVMAVILGAGVFAKTSMAVVVIFHLLAGLSLSSFALFSGSFFHKAQLSGISTTIICLLLAIVGQVVSTGSAGAIAVLGLIFPPMNYVFFTILMARFESKGQPTSLTKAAPTSQAAWALPGIAMWVFFVIQIVVYPILGALIERSLYGTASRGRTFRSLPEGSTSAVELAGFTKIYKPSWFFRHIAPVFGKRKDSVTAVNNLNLVAGRGQIMCLLGANGSGKTTTLEAIAGLNTVTSGTIEVDSSGGLGICPQKNVLWDELTVEEHVRIFNRLKTSAGTKSSKPQMRDLIAAVDLDRKIKARAKTLSGGQKRKLNLAMMFTGGSKVCAVDEVSSGLDPLSRRKIWDILLAERGNRTIILTTHFLDEAELLADHIAILSKGTLRAQGSAVELKHKLGGGYRIHIGNHVDQNMVSQSVGIAGVVNDKKTTYSVATSAEAAEVTRRLEASGVRDYQVAGPTIEDVFLKIADEVGANGVLRTEGFERQGEDNSDMAGMAESSERPSKEMNGAKTGLDLLPGKRIGIAAQAWVLFRKRLTILRRNYLPYCAAFVIPVIAAGLVTLFLKGYTASGCSPTDNILLSDINSLSSQLTFNLVVGPTNKLSLASFNKFSASLPGAGDKAGGQSPNIAKLMDSIHTVNTYGEFNDYVARRYANVTPGGFFLGDDSSPPTIAWKGNGGIFTAIIAQNALNTLLTNVSISTQYSNFDVPWQPSAGKTLQLITYFGLAMSTYPAFFALYPTLERLRNVRALHYSNGVRSLPLWFAYTAFDFCITLLVSTVVTIIFAVASSTWYHIGYLFVVFMLYGLASILLSYVISLFSRSQLAAFAFAAGGQCVMFLVYFVAYLSVETYVPVEKKEAYVNVAHFTIAIISPSANLIRALFLALNVLAISCRNRAFIAYPGEMVAYGGPITYLLLQSFFLFGVCLWWDSGSIFARFRKSKSSDEEGRDSQEKEVMEELTRVTSSRDGLRVLGVTKSFGDNIAVEDVTFGVPRGEVFALLGPNGAGKSTTISLIRGDIRPSVPNAEILVEDISILKHRASARAHLGVCPQFDAMDQMTVLEQLRFYARIRGVSNVEHNVREVVKAVGLGAFQGRMAAKLSGGNKRKLSLGVALMGNPTVLLLDEPSSGMDAAAKRVMWRTLEAVVPGRSIVLTTHSMEEADALANRAGILSRKMLAIGTSDHLRERHGNRYHCHLVTKTAPHTPSNEMDNIRLWVMEHFPSAEVEVNTYHGQLRFSVPASLPIVHGDEEKVAPTTSDDKIKNDDLVPSGSKTSAPNGTISELFTLLEENKTALGLEYYSVSQTTLDQVFLSIVSKHHVQEENYGTDAKKGWRKIFKWAKKNKAG